MSKAIVTEFAEREAQLCIEAVESDRKKLGVSMRALSSEAGLRPTSYWGIVRSKETMRAVKASTLFALQRAVDIFAAKSS